MTKVKGEKPLSINDLRHAEYYGMQKIFDSLYAKSQRKEIFTDLVGLILSRENILLAYRNIKTNKGSGTAGTDKLTIKDIGKLTPDEVVEKIRFIVTGSKHGYRPKPVRRKDIPKNGQPHKTRPLGIPCIWDRMVQQCIKQIIEPICEAKFSDNSFGFRPNRSAEHAIQVAYRLAQISKLHYVIEFDIKGFFDNVNHSKLIKQIWSMGIRDKHLIYILKQILKAPIKMPDGNMVFPNKGTPQGGIISPLLANIVLNELDHWVESQWQHNPVRKNYVTMYNSNGGERTNAFEAMKKTGLKEMRIVRYADDFLIFCRKKREADKAKIAIMQWLGERLKLETSPEKTGVVNIKHRYIEFLGFKIRVHRKANKHVVRSHMCDKAWKSARDKLVRQAKRIAMPSKGMTEVTEIKLYNSMVIGIRNYYEIATNVSGDCDKINRAVMTVFTNRINTQRGNRLVRRGRKLTEAEYKRYGKTRMLRFLAGTGEPIYPIGFGKHRNPMAKKRNVCNYTEEGRVGMHNDLRINKVLLHKLMRQPLYDRSAEYADNRISKFSAQWGKCAITGVEFQITEDIHCHHIIPRKKGGTDAYDNLVLVLEPIHKLIHATDENIITNYRLLLNLNKTQLGKLNNYRMKVGLEEVA